MDTRARPGWSAVDACFRGSANDNHVGVVVGIHIYIYIPIYSFYINQFFAGMLINIQPYNFLGYLYAH